MPQPQASTGSYLEYEYYTPHGDLETEIRSALLDLKDSTTNTLFEIDKSVWVMETGINYLISDNAYNFDDFEEQVETYEIDLTDQDFLHKGDLRDVILDLESTISQEVGTTKKYVATDVKVSEITSDKIFIDCHINYLIGVTSAPQPPYHCTLGTTNLDRVAGYAYYCPYQPGNGSSGAWTEARKNAQACLRNYWEPNPHAKPPKFYTNVLQYTSRPFVINKIYFAPDNLLGNSTAPYSSHQQPVLADACIYSHQQNKYAEVIYDDIEGLLGANRGLIYLTMYLNRWEDNNAYWVCNWKYDHITTGLNGFYTISVLTISNI